jgi:hypothetical protein
MAFVRPPLRDRTVLYLLSFTGYDEAHEVPQGLTQMGMAHALGCKRAQAAQVLIELKDKGMVRERVCHVKASPRRMKAFVLTADGRSLGESLRRTILERPLQFTDEEGNTKEVTVKEVLGLYPKRLDLAGLLRLTGDEGILTCEKVKAFLEKGEKKEEAPEPLKVAEPETIPLVCDDEPKEQQPVWAGPQPVETPPQGTEPVLTPNQPQYPQQYPQPYPQPYQQYYQPGYAAVPPDLFQQPPPKRTLLSRFGLVLGIILIGLGLTMFFTIGFEVCAFMLTSVVCGSLLILFYYISLRFQKVDVLDKKDRYMILGPALFMTYVICYVGSLSFNFKWDTNIFYSFLSVQLPLLFVLGAYPLIPAKARGQIGFIAGAFLILLSIMGLVGGKTFSWVYIHPVMWMATGAMAASIGNEVAKPERRDLGLWISTGLGLYIIAGSVMLIRAALTQDDFAPLITTGPSVIVGILALWLMLGILVVGLRGAKAQRLDSMFNGLGYTAVLCIGAAFVVFGLWLMRLGRFEGAVDLMVGLPVGYYALIQLKDSKNTELKAVGGLMAYAVLVEVLTLGLLLGLF